MAGQPAAMMEGSAAAAVVCARADAAAAGGIALSRGGIPFQSPAPTAFDP